MTNEIRERFYNDIKNKNMRMTKPRKAMVEILDCEHLTFKELQEAMEKKGYYNVSTLYNNLEFLLKEKLVVELFIDGDKYYELAIANPNHDVNNHIHLVKRKIVDNENVVNIKEIYAPGIISFIKEYDELKNIDISAVKIIIEGKTKQ